MSTLTQMTLSRLPVLLRFILLFAFLSVPLAGGGMVCFGLTGAAIGLVVAYVVLLGAAALCERWAFNTVGAPLEPSAGLKNSFASVLEQLRRRDGDSSQMPESQLFIFLDPLPNALCSRGVFGQGSIFLSSGLVAQLEERELREVLEACFLRLQQSEWIFISLCSALLSGVLSLAPRVWTDILFSTKPGLTAKKMGGPFSFVGFLIFLPAIRFLLRVGQPRQHTGARTKTWDAAMRKLVFAAQLTGREETPGLSPLSVSSWGRILPASKFFLPLP